MFLHLAYSIEIHLAGKSKICSGKEYFQKKKLYKNSQKSKVFGGEGAQDKISQKIANVGHLSIFNPFLCKIIYSWYCPKNGSVLDPFCGSAIRGIMASMLGREYTGIDIDLEAIDTNNKYFDKFVKKKFAENLKRPDWICEDSKNINKFIKKKFDFIFSCPPYWNLEIFSDIPGDLSTMTYNRFCQRLSKTIKKTILLLKDDRFACFVVSEIRNPRTGGYLAFVPFVIQAFISAGLIFYNDIIMIDVLGSAPIRGSVYFNSSRKVVRVHQNVLIFYKGDVKKIKQNFGEIKNKIEDSNLIKYFNGI